MNDWQRVAIENWTLTPHEQARPMFGHRTAAGTLVITVRTGWG
jgi:hypothetical protein